jgi:glycogen(starch) synthase
MRVAFVCNEFPPEPHGGIGSYVQTMAHALAGLGHVIDVVGFSDRDATYVEDGVSVRRLRRRRVAGLSWAANRIRLHRALTRTAAARGLDLVEVPDFEGWLPFPVPHVRTVVRLHQSYTTMCSSEGQAPPPGVRVLERRTLRRNPVWLSVSRHQLRRTTAEFGIAPGMAHVVPPAIVPRAGGSTGPVLEGPFVLFAGSISERKGALLLARAFSRVAPEAPELRLVYAGTATETGGRSIVEAIRDALGRDSSRVVFTGALSREGVRALMAAATIFALPSRVESFGMAVAEAMFERCPVLVPDAPPFDELVVHGATGWRVPAGERDADAFAEGLRHLLGDAALRERLGGEGHRWVAVELAPAVVVARTLEIYAAALRGGGAT